MQRRNAVGNHERPPLVAAALGTLLMEFSIIEMIAAQLGFVGENREKHVENAGDYEVANVTRLRKDSFKSICKESKKAIEKIPNKHTRLKYLKALKTLSDWNNRRNALVHGIWLTHPEIPGATLEHSPENETDKPVYEEITADSLWAEIADIRKKYSEIMIDVSDIRSLLVPELPPAGT